MAALGELLTSLTSSKKFEEQKGTRDRHVRFFCFWRATFSRLGCGISEELAGFVPSRMEV